MHLSAAIPGVDPGEPRRHLHPDICKYHLLRATKSYYCPSPGEHNLKGLLNCNIISSIVFLINFNNIIYSKQK